VTVNDLEAAAASTVEEAGLACGNLDELMGCLAGCFARVEPRRQARKYVTGLISDLPRKNCWALAEQAGDQTPDRMQRLLERAAWDADAAMRAVRTFVVSCLGGPAGAVLVLDESGQEKAGEHTAGVKRQYLGCAGRVANGINVVFASYAALAGHAVVSARLYVPKDWADDRERCQAAGIPEDLKFATKPQLAAAIVTDLLAEGRCPPWVTGDEVYGRDAKLRTFLEEQSTGYVLKIPCSFRVTLPAGQKIRADHAARLVPACAWQTSSAGHGSKGERDYGWAWLATASARHHLLIRRRLADPAELAYFWCYVPAGRPCSFTTLVRVAGRRWPVEIRHLRYRSTRVALSLPCSLSVGGLGPAGAAVEACRAGSSLAELLHLRGVCGDDPVLAAGGVPGGDPAAVDPVVDAGGGHAQGGGQAGDRPFAGCQAG
jgi:SRSO17 transposase